MARTTFPTGRGDALTRRRFLEHLGVVGGSSVLMTAMTSLDLMAGQAGARPSLSGKPARSRVVVLGAGLSGLVVGYDLQNRVSV